MGGRGRRGLPVGYRGRPGAEGGNRPEKGAGPALRKGARQAVFLEMPARKRGPAGGLRGRKIG